MNKQSLKTALRQVPSLVHSMEGIQSHTFQPAQRHRVYMSFVRNANGWYCRFHRDDLAKTPITRKFVFSSADRIYEAARRGNGLIDVESHHALDEAVTIGRGGVWLHLTEDQYSALVMPNPSNPGRN